ncbi:MAG: hypothetical protein M1834_001296 [Cirrosporium novae-zelandiae]|nr:MAG: hypothetical protein M1834_001296 [Cirrosporium novae-zelandiae]
MRRNHARGYGQSPFSAYSSNSAETYNSSHGGYDESQSMTSYETANSAPVMAPSYSSQSSASYHSTTSYRHPDTQHQAWSGYDEESSSSASQRKRSQASAYSAESASHAQPSSSSSHGASSPETPRDAEKHRKGSKKGKESSGNQDRYPCLYPECLSDFSRPNDLDRHYKSVHYNFGGTFDCPRRNCERKAKNGRAFTRQDHLTEHLRNFHDDPRAQKRTRGSS